MFLRNSLDICICSYSLAIWTVYILLLPGHLYMFLPKSLAICTCSYSLAIFTCSYVQKSLFICRCSYKSPWSSVHVPTKVPGHLYNVHVPTVIPGHLYMLLQKSLVICTCSYWAPWPSVHVPTKVPGHIYMFLLNSLTICPCSYSLAICTCSYKSPWSSVHVPTKLPGHLYMFLLPRRSYMFLIHDPNPWSICTWVLPKYNVYMFLQNWLDICSSFYNLYVPVVVKTAWRFVQVPTIYPSQLW